MGSFSKLTAKGQTTIPSEVRKALDIKPGDQIFYTVDEGKVVLSKRPSALDFAGILHDPKRRALSVEEMKLAWEEAALVRYEQSVDRS